ncbi:MAG TPA: hypothetical protein VFE70_04225, partial [Candidatus Elarobacter sp.]|nr:hypothetical protein [Candidatus Elarobacter sp.]
LEPWETVVVPAAAGRVAFIPGGTPTSALVVRPDPDLAAVRSAALSGGAEPSAADVFFAQFGGERSPGLRGLGGSNLTGE